MNSQKSTFDVLMSRLRMKQLQLLIALDEQKSLHKAAGAMAMTQSAASKALGELESMLGETIFERTKTGLVLNPFGRCVTRYARLMASEVTSLCREVADIRAGTGGRLTVGSIMGAIPEFVVPAVNALQKRYPALSIDIIEDTSSRMLALLDEGRVDLVLGRAAVSEDPSKYRYQTLGEEPLSVVVGCGHPPFPDGQIRFADLAGHRWVRYPASMPLGEFIQRELDLAGVSEGGGAISTASTFVTVALLQENDDLVSILPAGVAEMFSRKGMLRIVPVKFESRSQTFGIVTRRGPLSAMAEQFVEILTG